MTDTPFLDIEHVPAAATNKYLFINAFMDGLENALFKKLDVACGAGGTITVSATNLKENGFLNLTGAPGAGFTLALGAVNRSIIIYNGTGQTATVQAGTPGTTQTLNNASAGLFLIQTNDVFAVAGGGGGGYTDEAAQDAIGNAIAAGTQTGIIVTYRDADGALDFTVPGNSDYQESVRIISTTNLTLNGEYTTQGVALVAGDRVGAFGQTTGADRRIWVVVAGGDWTIADGWDVGDTITTNAQVTADEGTYEGQTYRLTTTGTIVLGTTSLTWEANEAAISQYTNRNVNGSAYTILSSDRNKWIYMTRAGNQTFTLEEYAVQPMANGAQFVVQYIGSSGTKVVTADAAVTLNGTAGGTITLSAQYDAWLFKQRSRNNWVAVPWTFVSGGGFTQEEIEDFIGLMVSSNTETGISVTYDDAAGKLNFAVNYSLNNTWTGTNWFSQRPTSFGDVADVQVDGSSGFLNFAYGNNFHWHTVNVSYGNHASGPSLAYYKTRNASPTGHTKVESGDNLLEWWVYASDGVNAENVAYARAVVAGATASDQVPTAWEFWTTNTDDVAMDLRFTFGPLGQLQIGSGKDAGSAGEFLRSGGASAAPSWEPIPKEMIIAVSNETTSITTGTAKVTFRAPRAMTLTGIKASLSVAGSSGTTVDVNLNGSTIMTTNKLNFDASERTTATFSGSAAALTTTAVADDDEFTIDIDTAGTGAKGLKVTLLYT